jgi:hypothetical protein
LQHLRQFGYVGNVQGPGHSGVTAFLGGSRGPYYG